MIDTEKELLVHRILAGYIRCKTSEGTYLYKTASVQDKYIAEEIYQDTLHEAQLMGALTDYHFDNYLESKKIWNLQLETRYLQTFEDIENLKVALFNTSLQTVAQRPIRVNLKKTKAEAEELHRRKHSYDHVSAAGVALLAKARFLTGMSIHTEDGEKVFTHKTYWLASTSIIDAVSSTLSKKKINDEQFRELARTEPWRGYWNCKRSINDNLFPCSIIGLTDEQRTIIHWSQMYDSIMEHPECPTDGIIEDDDMLDGWLIIQRRKRKSEHTKSFVEGKLTNEKIRNSNEVFIVTSPEQAHQVYDANPPDSRALLKRKMDYLEKKGEVEVSNSPEEVFAKQQQLTQMYRDKVK